MKQFILPTIIVLAALSGCVRYTDKPQDEVVLSDEQKQFASIWQAAGEVLTEYRFEIDRIDAREGTIVTKPMVSAAALEFWRDDVTTTDSVRQSLIHKTYCLAIVKISPSLSDEENYAPHTRVLFARSNEAPAQLTSAAQIAMVFTGGGTALDYGVDEVERQMEQAADRSFKTDKNAAGNLQTPTTEPSIHPEMPDRTSLGRLVDFEARIDQKIRTRAAKLLAEMD